MNDQQVRRDRALQRQNLLAARLDIQLRDNLAALFPAPTNPCGAHFEGRLVGFFGLTETVEQPDHDSVVLRLGPGGTYERVFLAEPKAGAA